ncbi:IclR family transcriptional regulator domain-containing protein [Glutamicibacter mysorens]|uniref:IclR family transcriptional regulator domain-containing protein n=1 Tax=Glutamicibacter mysorens TaxID=257984 RepID=UPI0020C5C13D|nr:IclR family transcriptional regulator C-terminal domain-containing protein [Glutamicibacter mysorens]UTM45740.1 helix-turn-helix domain-containing protein [Glutamicibacter mysorens]
MNTPNKNADYVESLDRGLNVLRVFSEKKTLTVADVAVRSGITRTAARRFVLTLEHLGYVTQCAGGYTLYPAVLELGDAYLQSNPLVDLSYPYLGKLVDQVHESASITVLHGLNVYYIARAAADRIVTANITVGQTLPAHFTAVGSVLLSGLSEDELAAYFELLRASDPKVDTQDLRAEIAKAKKRGWAMTRQAHVKGIRSVAVPVLDAEGRIIAAANIAAHSSRANEEEFKEIFLPLLQATASEITTALGENTSSQILPRPENDESERPSDAIQSVERGLRILKCFIDSGRRMNLAQLTAAGQMPRSAARRFVHTLVTLGYLNADGKNFTPTPLVLELGYSLLTRITIADIIKPHLEELSEELGASVSVGVLEEKDLRYVMRISAPSPLRVNIHPGSRLPARNTAMGQVLLAAKGTKDFLEIREREWAYVDQLLETGIRAIAVPLRNRRGEVVAALSASVHEEDTLTEEMTNTFLPALQRVANELARELRDGMDI